MNSFDWELKIKKICQISQQSKDPSPKSYQRKRLIDIVSVANEEGGFQMKLWNAWIELGIGDA